MSGFSFNNRPRMGGAKKFLYTGPKKGNDDEDDDMPWNFNSKNQKQNTGNTKFEMDGVWSIQRNMNVTGGTKAPKSDGLTYNANNKYYSRHSGANKDKDDFGSFLDGVNTKNGNSGNYGNSDQGGKSWSVGNQASRRPFSYAYENKNPPENPTSPRNVSNSSTGVYPQTDSNMFYNQTGSGMNSGNLNSFRGGNSMSQENGNGFNSQSMDKPQNTNNSSVYNKTIMSSPTGATNSFNPTPRNSLFNSSPQMNSGLLGTGAKRPNNNKSMW